MFEPDSDSSSLSISLYPSEGELQFTSKASKFEKMSTINIPGSRYIPAEGLTDIGARTYFSGYVFRGDFRGPEIIFKQGFMLNFPVLSIGQMHYMTGRAPDCPGYTGSHGISTSVRARTALMYTSNPMECLTGYLYLIDAMEMAGFAIPAGYEPSNFSGTPDLKQIDEVCFPCPIPNTSVVGFVRPESSESKKNGLNLVVNSEYWSDGEKGLAAAKKVLGLFTNSFSLRQLFYR